MTQAVASALAVMLLLLLQSCGGGSGESLETETPPLAARYSVGGSVSGLDAPGLVLRRNPIETLEVTADGAFSFPTALRRGERYEVVVAQQPTRTNPRQVCQVTNDSGVVGSEPVRDVIVACRDMTARHLHVAVEGTQSVQTFSIDPGTGALNEIDGSPKSVSVPKPRLLATSPDERFLYVLGSSESPAGTQTHVAVLQIDADTGRLSDVPNGTLTIPGTLASAPAFLRSGRALYLSAAESLTAPNPVENRIHAFVVDPQSGTLTSAPGSPYVLPDAGVPRGAAILSADDGRLYVAYGAAQGAGAAVFSVNPLDGSLLPQAQTQLSFLPTALVLSPGGRYLCVVGSGALATAAIDTASGDLILSGEVQRWDAWFDGANSLQFSPSGRQAYLLSTRQISAGATFINNIGVFDVDGVSGSLAEVPSSRVSGGGTWAMPYLFVEPRGRYLIAARGATASPSPRTESVWSVWAIEQATGRLSGSLGSPAVSGLDAERIHQASLDRSGRYLFSTDYVASTITSHRFDLTTGAVSTAGTAQTGLLPRGFVMVGLH